MTFAALVNIFVTGITDFLVPIIIGFMVIVFLNGLRKFILKADDPGEHKKGRDLMIYGLLGLVIAMSVWSIVGILAATFGASPFIPQLK